MDTAERRVVAALWSLRGVGPKTIASVKARVGELGALLGRSTIEWRREVPLTAAARRSISAVRRLDEVADRLEATLRSQGNEVVFPGQDAFPQLLAEIPQAPPLLFLRGPGARAPPRLRVAMVGTRRPDYGFLDRARALARDIGARGIGVVSGAADGVDQACHLGAVEANAETWAFIGCALDQMDVSQETLCRRIASSGASFFSEYPPGTRSEPANFPRRNRLISGSANAVLVLRAGLTSGALYTAKYAAEQGRPVLALPGDAHNPAALGCNLLLKLRHASMCLDADDVAAAVGARQAQAPGSPPIQESLPLGSSPRAVFTSLDQHPRTFEELLERSRLESGELAAALVELELAGYVTQRPGRLYEKTQR